MVPFFCMTSVIVVSAMHGGEPAVMTSWMFTWLPLQGCAG